MLTAYPSDPLQILNNFLQFKGMINDLQYDMARQGPPSRPVLYAIFPGLSWDWTILDSYSQRRNTRRRESTKGGKVKDEAARMALKTLSTPPTSTDVNSSTPQLVPVTLVSALTETICDVLIALLGPSRTIVCTQRTRVPNQRMMWARKENIRSNQKSYLANRQIGSSSF